MATLSRRERTLIGLGALTAAVIAGHLYLIEPLLGRIRQANELAPAREATLERRRLLIAQRGRLAQELAMLKDRLEAARGRLLPGATAPLAAAELQRVVKELATAANVEVRSERVLPVAERSGLQEVPLELSVVGSIRELLALLAKIEEVSTLLTLRDLKIKVVAPGQPKDLMASLTVVGYFLPGASLAPPGPPAGAAPGPRSPGAPAPEQFTQRPGNLSG